MASRAQVSSGRQILLEEINWRALAIRPKFHVETLLPKIIHSIKLFWFFFEYKIIRLKQIAGSTGGIIKTVKSNHKKLKIYIKYNVSGIKPNLGETLDIG